MNKLKRILLAFDFLETTKPAIAKAAFFAQKFGAELAPVHAVEYMPYHYGHNYWHVIYDEIQPRVEALCQSWRDQGIKVGTPIIKEGRPYDVILGAADELRPNLVVIGGGRPTLMGRVVGTTTAKIIRNANQAVCVVHRKEKQAEIKKILCAVDFSLASNHVMTTAIPLAKALKAELSIYHVVPKSKHYPGIEQVKIPVIDLQDSPCSREEQHPSMQILEERVRSQLSHFFEDYLRKFNLKGIKHKRLLGIGSPESEIVATCKKEEIDLLVMGTIGQHGLSRILVGNTTEKVMSSVRCSTITVRHRDIFHMFDTVTSMTNRRTRPRKRDVQATITFLEKHYQRGRTFLDAGKPRKALAEFEKCIARDEHFAAAYEDAARASAGMGDDVAAAGFRDLATNARRYLWDLQLQPAPDSRA